MTHARRWWVTTMLAALVGIAVSACPERPDGATTTPPPGTPAPPPGPTATTPPEQLLPLPPTAGYDEATRKALFPIIDVHTHLNGKALGRIETVMAGAGLATMVNMSGGNQSWGMSRNIKLAQATQGKVLNFYTPDFDGIDEPWWGEIEALKLEDAVTGYGYEGLKINKGLGLGLHWASGVLIDVDDPVMAPLWDKAGELGVPVLIHTGDPKAFWQPIDEGNERYAELSVHPAWGYYGKPVPSRMELLAQRDELLDAHLGTDFILAHFGGNPEDLDYLDDLLDRHDNAFLDIAARIPEIGRHPPEKVRAFFIKHQDRILFGTDIGIGPTFLMLGSSDGTTPPLSAAKEYYTTIFEYLESDLPSLPSPTPIQGDWQIYPIHLPEPVLHKVYHGNAERLLYGAVVKE